MRVSERLIDIATVVLEQGQPVLFKRLIHASVVCAKHDSNTELSEGIIEDLGEDADSPDRDEEDSEEEDAEDVEGNFAGFPMGALGVKERRRGPHEKDVAVGKPDWWNPR